MNEGGYCWNTRISIWSRKTWVGEERDRHDQTTKISGVHFRNDTICFLVIAKLEIYVAAATHANRIAGVVGLQLLVTNLTGLIISIGPIMKVQYDYLLGWALFRENGFGVRNRRITSGIRGVGRLDFSMNPRYRRRFIIVLVCVQITIVIHKRNFKN